MRSGALLITLLCGAATAGDLLAAQVPPVADPKAAGQTPPAPAKAGEKLPPEAIEQLVAGIALYSDDLLSQVLMASTYPLEVVQARRWQKENAKLEGDALAKALEEQEWDPSVKSLIAAPQVLQMMDEKLDWMQKLGDAFLAQQKDVMEAIQRLRQRAKDEGHLKTTAEQEVESEGDTIIVTSTNTEVIYVPTYDPTVVYGYWGYPAYPPYYWYPPGYYGGYAFASFAIGVAWGYAWGGCHWGHHEVDIDIDRNTDINREIDRGKYKQQMQDRAGTREGKGSWQHDPSHRRGVGYSDAATAKKFDRGRSPTASTREGYRGRSDQAGTAGATSREGSRATGSAAVRARNGSKSTSSASKKKTGSSALSGQKSGKETRAASQRGSSSRNVSRPSGGSRGGGRGGGGRGGGRRG